MTEPAAEDQDAGESPPKRVRVPIRRGDSIFSFDEHADVEAAHADVWDARLWHDRPPR